MRMMPEAWVFQRGQARLVIPTWGNTAPDLACVGFFVTLIEGVREVEKFITRQPSIGEKDDYDSENSWISDGLPSSSRRRRRGDGRWEVGEWREK